MSARHRSRVEMRPHPADWPEDAPMTLDEMVAVFASEFPMTVSTLRTEIRHGRLQPAKVAGSFYVTPAQIRALFRPAICPAQPKGPASTYEKAGSTGAPASASRTSGSSETAPMSAAQAAARIAVAKLKSSSPATSPKNGPRRPRAQKAEVIPLRSLSTTS